MSIIFNKLEKLKQNDSSGLDANRQKGLYQRANVYTFRKLLFTPKGILLVFAVITGFGLISFYSLAFLKEHLDSASKNAIVIENRQFKVPASFIPKIKEPEISNYDTSKPNNQDIKFLKKETKKTVKSVQQTEIIQLTDNTKSTKTVNPEPTKTSNIQPAVNTTNPVNIENVKVTETIKQTQAETIKKIQVKTAQQLEQRRKKQKRINKVSDIATIGSSITNAFQQNDKIQVDKLLAKIGKIKGKDSIYYLKLNAFKQIKLGNYDSAKKILNKVLEKNQNDFEAGFNMAVIEIKKQEFDTAKQRLIDLKELYPSKKTVNDLLDQLK